MLNVIASAEWSCVSVSESGSQRSVRQALSWFLHRVTGLVCGFNRWRGRLELEASGSYCSLRRALQIYGLWEGYSRATVIKGAAIKLTICNVNRLSSAPVRRWIIRAAHSRRKSVLRLFSPLPSFSHLFICLSALIQTLFTCSFTLFFLCLSVGLAFFIYSTLYSFTFFPFLFFCYFSVYILL